MAKATLREIPGMIARREDFEGNSLSGYKVQNGSPSLGTLGALPYKWQEKFFADRDRGIWYIVFSYATPIAWVTGSGDAKEIVIPDVKYSVTTSKHQGKVRAGFAI